MSKTIENQAATDQKATTAATDATQQINVMVENSKKALEKFMDFDQQQIDKIVKAMATAGLSKHMELSKITVAETGRGIVEDKVIKNIFATEYVYNDIKNLKTVGIVCENQYDDTIEIAEPIGIVAAVTPVTNPTSTTMFKALIAIKARNPIIFGFHPSAQNCSVRAADILYQAALKAGAPKHCIQWVEKPSIAATGALMNHKDVAIVLATGGSAMVNAAYSTGKPALGVGPGNVPCYINKSANLEAAVNDLIMSKSFDNGMICASEQAAIVDSSIADKFEKLMTLGGCYFCNEAEIKMLSDTVIKPNGAVNADIVGKYPVDIAKLAGFTVPSQTKILVAKIAGVSEKYPLSREKLSPVLAMIVVANAKEGIEMADKMLEMGGLGHSAVIHAKDPSVIEQYTNKMRAGRLLVNSPSSQGAIGDIYNTLRPSLTLGCGSYGQNSTTENVGTLNLINIKRVAKRRTNMQWFKLPPKLYFEFESTQYLEKMPEISRAFIVTDASMVQFKYVDKVLHYLNKRTTPISIEVFSDVEPDPSLQTIERGVKAMNAFKPDVIIALGGGSAMDAAKGMWLFYEQPDVEFSPLTYKFLDIRKRVVDFPKIGKKSKMVCIPTTSGTGSEVTAFSVITDSETNTKYPLADYELTPDVAIIDPSYVMSVPKSITADTGMDVLTHAIEAYVSILANDFTDGIAMQAIKLAFKWLKVAYDEPSNREARNHMHNASCLAGMAFTNSFLGINHSLAHKLGGEFHIPHGRANAILLPYVIEFNAGQPSKFAPFPRYEKFIAPERYCEIAVALGLEAKTTQQGVENLIKAIKNLITELNIPSTIKECGIDEKKYFASLDMLSEKAYEDQCTTANPRQPLIKELKEIYSKIF